MRKLRIVFFGMNGRFTIDPLSAVASSHDIVGIVVPHTIPNQKTIFRKMGSKLRHKLILPLGRINSVRGFCSIHRVPLLEFNPSSQSEIIKPLQKLKADLFCVASFPCLLKPEVFSLAPLGCINMHPSLLPDYRGPNPFFWVYHNQESRTGVTVHYIDAGEDSGTILAQESFEVPFGLPSTELLSKTYEYGKRLMKQVVDNISENQVQIEENPKDSSTCRAIRPNPNIEYVDWSNWPVRCSFHFLRGVMPMWYIPPSLKNKIDMRKYYLDSWKEDNHSEKPMTIIKSKGEFCVYGFDGCLIFKRVALTKHCIERLKKFYHKISL